MLDSGIHFGHHCSRWNPKMAPFIYAKRNAIHIIDIRETLRGILRAQRFLARVVARGDDVLFVGTKRQAREPVQQAAERCGMHYVNERWLGGTLTNFRTIRSRLQRLEELEALCQSPQWESGYSKKMKATLLRELERIRRNLSGIRRMIRLPGALVVIDVRKEINALREARALGIPTVCLIDTDSDPDYVSIPIPGNDDAMRAIQFVCSKLADAIEEAKRARPEPLPQADSGEGDPGFAPRRRPRRVLTVEPASEGAAVLAAAEGSAEAGAAPGFEAEAGEPSAPTAG
jgi:small subunit ribosomal protein S2